MPFFVLYQNAQGPAHRRGKALIRQFFAKDSVDAALEYVGEGQHLFQAQGEGGLLRIKGLVAAKDLNGRHAQLVDRLRPEPGVASLFGAMPR